MSNKICGECKHFYDYADRRAPCCWSKPTDNACLEFEQKVITNGDKLRQLSNEEFAKLRVYHCPPVRAGFCKGTDTVKCVKCWLGYLNAPAESDGEDE